MQAAKNNHPDAMVALLDAGADLTPREHFEGFSALDLATGYHHPEAVQVLLEHGADVNQRDKYGITPLIRAVCIPLDSLWQDPGKDEPELVQPFLDHGANVNARSPGGYTALEIAQSTNHPRTAELLWQASQKSSDFVDVPKKHWAYQAVSELKQMGILIGYPGPYPMDSPEAAWKSLLNAVHKRDMSALQQLLTPKALAFYRRYPGVRGVLNLAYMYTYTYKDNPIKWTEKTEEKAQGEFMVGSHTWIYTFEKTQDGWKLAEIKRWW
jgi:hypothetical protein